MTKTLVKFKEESGGPLPASYRIHDDNILGSPIDYKLLFILLIKKQAIK